MTSAPASDPMAKPGDGDDMSGMPGSAPTAPADMPGDAPMTPPAAAPATDEPAVPGAMPVKPDMPEEDKPAA